MSAKSLPEASGKHLLSTHLPTSTLYTLPPSMLCSHTFTTQSETNTQFQQLEKQNPWLRTEKLVVKPDQLIKRRGKAGLLGLNLEWTNAKTWIIDRQGKEIKVKKEKNTLALTRLTSRNRDWGIPDGGKNREKKRI